MLLEHGFLEVKTFRSEAVVREPLRKKGNLETLSMVMVDVNYDDEVFDLDVVFYAEAMAKGDWTATFPLEGLGTKVMVVFLNIYGNEAREVIPAAGFQTAGKRKSATANKQKR